VSGTLTDRGVFFLVLFLTLLLILFIYAVITMPPEAAGSQEQPVLDMPAPPMPAPPAPAPEPLPVRRPRTLASQPQPGAFGQPGNGGYAARHATVAVPVITPPKVSGGPPWGPAPKPPGVE
jgi:hypothetical protein